MKNDNRTSATDLHYSSTGRLNTHDPVLVMPVPALDGLGLTMLRFLKKRDEAGPFLIQVDLESKPVKFTDLDWLPGDFVQAEDRISRRIRLSGAKLPGHLASRNEREGIYAFKVNGRHARRKRTPSILTWDLKAPVFKKLEELACE